MKIRDNRITSFILILIGSLGLSGCAENIRKLSSEAIAQRVIHLPSTPDKMGLTWLGSELHISHYRTLFFGYDTIDYRFAATEHPETNNVILLIDARYGGDNRHYDYARMQDNTHRKLNNIRHEAERCQIFNSLISSCLYRDRFSLSFTKAELEFAHHTGIYFTLSSNSHRYEEVDIPPNYITGFLSAIAEKPLR